jgi:ATP-dependent protease ClpP protease subunit
MHHEASYDAEGRHTEIKSVVAEYERQEQLWSQWMADFSKKPKKFYYEEGKSTDKFWTPEQLVEFGIADEIV